MGTKNILRTVLALLLGGGALSSCAHTDANRSVDSKIAQEQPVSNSQALAVDARAAINRAPGLTADQRAKLLTLQSQTQAKSSALQAQSLKLRELLVDELTQANYNADEVKVIQDRIRSVEDQRVSNIMSAVNQANTILGRTENRNKMVHSFDFEGRGMTDFEARGRVAE